MAIAAAQTGHNNPPDPIDEALAPYGDAIAEAETWLDNTVVETEGQMHAADELRKQLRQARLAVEAAEKSEVAPLHDAWKAAKARYKPTLDDVTRIEKGLVALVDAFKRRLANEKAAAAKAAWAAADAARAAAEKAAMLAAPTDIEAQRAADAAKQASADAAKQASATAKDQVKGLRTTHFHEVEDARAALHWIAANDREAITAFVLDYAAKNFRRVDIAGVRVWTDRVAV